MQLFTDEVISDLLAKSLETATIDEKGWHDVGKGPGSPAGKFIKWLTISNLAVLRVDAFRFNFARGGLLPSGATKAVPA